MPDAVLDRDYIERRAEQELECAYQACHPKAVKAHYEMLGLYLNKLYPAPAPTTDSRGVED